MPMPMPVPAATGLAAPSWTPLGPGHDERGAGG